MAKPGKSRVLRILFDGVPACDQAQIVLTAVKRQPFDFAGRFCAS